MSNYITLNEPGAKRLLFWGPYNVNDGFREQAEMCANEHRFGHSFHLCDGAAVDTRLREVFAKDGGIAIFANVKDNTTKTFADEAAAIAILGAETTGNDNDD